MSIDDLMKVTEVFGPGGGLLVFLGMLAIGVLVPVLRREQKAPKDTSLVKGADILVFMAKHDMRMQDVERRVGKLEDKCGSN